MKAQLNLGVTPWHLHGPTAASLSDQAVRAESLGYGSFWLPESHFGPDALPDPLMLLSAVAAATCRIRLATTSYLLPLRHPLLAAEQVAVLDRLSGGRVTLGVGRGYAPHMLRAFDVDPRSKRSLFETALARMIEAWSGAPLPVDGPEGSPVKLEPLPLQRPHPPVWVAAFGPKALAQAGRLGLPYLASPVETLHVLEENQRRHHQAAAEAGHPPPAEVPVMRTLFVTESRRETRELREALHKQAMASGRLPAQAVPEDWCVVGEAGYVQEAVECYRQRLGMTTLIVTRMRLAGAAEQRLIRSVTRAAELLGSPM